MKKHLLISGLLLSLGLGGLALADEGSAVRNESEGYRRVEDETVRPAPPVTAESMEDAGVTPLVINEEMAALKEGFEQRRAALLGVIRSTADMATINSTELQLEQLRQEQNLAEYELLLRQAEQAGRTERANELREVIRQETAPVPAPVQTERVLSHEEKLGLQQARENAK
jgi:hypothetical protein